LRDSTEVTVDPFSDILRLANARSVVSGGFTAGGSWAIRFPAFDKLKFSALIRGRCWLSTDGGGEPLRIEAGDAFLLSSPQSFTLASDLAVAPIEAARVFSPNVSEVVSLGGGEDCLQIGGFVRLDPACGGLLVDVLPPLIHVRAVSPHAAVLRWLLDQLVHEQLANLPGSHLAAEQIAQLVFIQILRAHLEASGALPPGWLRALGDNRIAPALRMMHSDPSRSWQLEELAKATAMSRTTFVVRFKTVAGVPPLTYLLNWRMRLAERALRTESVRVAALALSLGYTSESAFSNAFKRTVGMSPKRYREAARKQELEAA
jgi:AraC-like DNA-binding protein